MSARRCSLPAPPREWRQPSARHWRRSFSPSNCCCLSSGRAPSCRCRPRWWSARRWPLLGIAPIFPTDHVLPRIGAEVLCLCAAAGVVGGFIAWLATSLVYLSEDAFRKLPIHWMWWPAIGGLIIGVGGLIEPRALGVGYDVIGTLLAGRATLALIVGILVVKTLIWSLSLGSGTSGGVLAPTFMIGGALGALEGQALPHVFAGFWAICGLAAVVGGVMRSPLTGIVFTLELTHAYNDLFPLLIASVSA